MGIGSISNGASKAAMPTPAPARWGADHASDSAVSLQLPQPQPQPQISYALKKRPDSDGSAARDDFNRSTRSNTGIYQDSAVWQNRIGHWRVREQKPGLVKPPIDVACDALIEIGRTSYQQWCVSCHGAGRHTPGKMALHFNYQGQVRAVLTEREDLTAEIIDYYIRHGVSVMPSFRKTEISDQESRAIAAYKNRSVSQSGTR